MSFQEQPQEQQRSLYRRHRPRTFAEVVGQEPVVRTLRNAVEREKVHHAYLFVGSRGTGKTSMAKILAACLNCERGPTVEPCGKCDSCLSIARASSLDVIEMDAASNNSVDDIRDLRESVAYAPVSGRRKVYILDEAHMLSTAAWNAFLKTLEEPPPNTVFVLATTEAGKVPATVVDRCHRFDFHRPSVEQLATVLRRTAEAESIQIPPAAVAAIARSATGSFRDALGTLEQLVTYTGSEIALQDVLAVLGVADSALLERTVDAIAAGDSRGALIALEECVEQGRDAGSFASDLEVRARELLVVQTLGEVPGELALTPEADAALLAQAERVDHGVIVRLLELIGGALEAVRAGADARTRLELALVKAARPDVDSSMRALLARLERLERGEPLAAVSPAPAKAQPHPPAQPQPPAPASAEHVPNENAEGSGRQTQEPTAGAGASAADGEPPAAAVGLADSAPAQPAEFADAAAGATGDIGSVRSLWPAVVDLVRGENAMLGALIAEAQPVEMEGEELTVAFASSKPFLRKKASVPLNRAAVTEALRAVTGTRWHLSFELRDELGEDQERSGPPARSDEEWVARFMEEFDAEEVPGEWGGSAEGGTVTSDEELEAAASEEKGN
ncbi:MAG TPA: DNA polymerase III subunit gamma/tau [Solirubrobacteraceae bacterium]|nr:DNA polymerase III subunit gamma/tau [Solirubrobacteraceae bacterium]